VAMGGWLSAGTAKPAAAAAALSAHGKGVDIK
jgi:hypothetical protein